MEFQECNKGYYYLVLYSKAALTVLICALCTPHEPIVFSKKRDVFSLKYSILCLKVQEEYISSKVYNTGVKCTVLAMRSTVILAKGLIAPPSGS